MHAEWKGQLHLAQQRKESPGLHAERQTRHRPPALCSREELELEEDEDDEEEEDAPAALEPSSRESETAASARTRLRCFPDLGAAASFESANDGAGLSSPTSIASAPLLAGFAFALRFGLALARELGSEAEARSKASERLDCEGSFAAISARTVGLVRLAPEV